MSLIVFGLYFVVSGPYGNGFAQGLPKNIQVINDTELKAKLDNTTKPTLLFIYASWCPYCKKQMGILKQLHQESSLSVLSVSTDRSAKDLSEFVDFHQPPWTSYIYNPIRGLNVALEPYGLNLPPGVPYMILFKNGKAVQEFAGLTERAAFLQALSR
jgi:thiol-disulfide isomerase/thioredoxin